MSFGPDNKNGNASLGSIKDRIKSFEVMKDSDTTSPRARSPVSALNSDHHRTVRRTINWERDGSERRQIRRSERREAESRRVSEMLVKKEKHTEVDSSNENNIRSARKTPSRTSERRPPRVAPRHKEKPPEPPLRRKIQDYKESSTSVIKEKEPSVETNHVSHANMMSPRTTESSSNEAIDLNTSDEPVGMSSEDTGEIAKKGKVDELTEKEGEEEDTDEEEEEGKEVEEKDGEEQDEEEEEGQQQQEEEQEEEENGNDDTRERLRDEKFSMTEEVDNPLRDKIANYKNICAHSKRPKHNRSYREQEETESHSRRDRGDTTIKPTEVPSERSERNRGKSFSVEEHHSNESKSKSSGKALRRKMSRNSMKSHDDGLDGANKHHDGKCAESKTKHFSGSEDSDASSGPVNLSVRTNKRHIEEETAGQQNGNEKEITSSSSQLNIYSSNVLGMIPANIQKSVEMENEAMPSGDVTHDDPPQKRTFVCPIHEEHCKYYCQNCERLICSECAMRWGDCHEHYYLRVKDAWKKYREEMMKILQEARSSVSRIQEDILENSKVRDSFKLKVDSTVKKINNFFDQHVQALEKRRTSFLESVEEIMMFRQIGINQEIESLQNNLMETSSTINIAGRVYGTSTMMEFLQVCKQLTNHLLELGQKKTKAHLMENVDIDFITEQTLYEQIENLGQLKKHRFSLPSNSDLPETLLDDLTASTKSEGAIEKESKSLESTESKTRTDSDTKREKAGNLAHVAEDSLDTSLGTSTENLSESTSAKDTNDIHKKVPESSSFAEQPDSSILYGNQRNNNDERKADDENAILVNGMEKQSFYKDNDPNKDEPVKLRPDEQYPRGQKVVKGKEAKTEEEGSNPMLSSNNVEDNIGFTKEESEVCFCRNDLGYENTDHPKRLFRNSYIDEKVASHEGVPFEEKNQELHYPRRHSMDDTLGSRSKKDEIQRRLGQMGKFRPHKNAQFTDEGERYFSSGEAEQRRRKQEYYKVRFNDRAYYSNPSDSSELEEMRSYNLDENIRPMRQKVRRHRTMPLIRPISERQRDKSPWTLDVFRYHGKIHFSRNSLKATGKAFGWNAVIGSQGFSEGVHSWKVRVTKWTAVGVCYKDDHIDNPSWGAGNKWTWDSADMCFSPRLGVCESPVGEWIDGDVIALELDCDNSVLIVHNLRTQESDKLFGFKEPVYPYFYLSVFRSISITEIDGVQVG